jgi:hypothetical protein
MRVLIEINCESVGELTTHLYEMVKQVKALSKKIKLDPHHDELPIDTVLEDDNCYGEHELKVVTEPL